MACMTKTTLRQICALSFALLHIAVFACSIAIVSIIALPITPDIEYSRVVVNENGTIRNDIDEWPFKIKVRPENFFCSRPNPNFDVTDEQLNDAWYLPKKSALSPLMRDIGRCKLASKSLRKFDDRKCDCVAIWWVGLVLIIAIAELIFDSLCYCMCCSVGIHFCVGGWPSASETNTTKANRDNLIYCCWCFAWSGLWLGVFYMFYMRNYAVGLSYTAYGDVFAQAYYNKEPTQWIVISLLCSVQSIAEIAKVVCFQIAFKENEAKNQNVTNADPPPPYKSLRSAKESNGKV